MGTVSRVDNPLEKANMEFQESLFSIFKFSYCIIPFVTRNIKYINNQGKTVESMIGYTDVYIFGIRIIRIQRTNPW